MTIRSGSELRVYEADECGKDGYPLAWHESVKDAVREEAGHRCVRCGHPYRKGEHGNGEWTPCDEECAHGGPIRVQAEDAYGKRGDYGIYDDEVGEALASARSLRGGAGIYNPRAVARWRILTVHHLTGDKADCRWWNLAALCQRCHLTIQGRVKMEQVYPHEHSDWFKPYAAGYYAATYLEENLTRPETIERLDELLGLELAQSRPSENQ